MAHIHFNEKGDPNGHPVILIHGFPFNSSMWNEFSQELDPRLRIILMDLPGFGSSELLPGNFSIDDVAVALIKKIRESGITDCILVGHSLGGYVALAMVRTDPGIFSGLVLFHSTAFADSTEKKENRNKVLDFVDRHGVLAFTGSFIPPLFADQKHPAIEKVRQIAVAASTESVTGYTKAMRDRKDYTGVLKQFHKPVLMIGGDKDQGIPPLSLAEQGQLSTMIKVQIIQDVAHMGMFENSQETVRLIQDFIDESNRR